MEYINCILCNSNKYTNFLEAKDPAGKKFNIVKCNCGLVFMNPRPSADERIDYYPDDYFPYSEKKSIKKPQNRLKSLIKKLIPKGEDLTIVPYRGEGKILDIGCGDGAFLYKLKQLGWETHGIELNKKAADFARNNFGLNIINGDFDNLTLEKNFFDVVNMLNVLEHLPDPLSSLKKVNAILRSDGMVIIRVPNIESFEAKICKEKWAFLDPPHHLYHFSPKTIKDTLNKCGFKIKKNKYDFNDLSGLNGCLEIMGFKKEFIARNRLIRRILKFFNFWFACLHKCGIMVVYATKGM